MKLIKPSYEILTPINGDEILRTLEIAGRTCYKSEDKITDDSAKVFVAKIIKSGHHSVIEHISLSIRFITDRGVSHELVRHRLASFSQESTRYCNYSKDKFGNELTFIIPPWLNLAEGNYYYPYDMANSEVVIHNQDSVEWTFVDTLGYTEESYKALLQDGWSPQQARSVLPNALKTEIVVTANLREWRLILTQRTASGAHPQMRELMMPLLAELKTKIPIIFDDI